jgi:hypothetical protein
MLARRARARAGDGRERGIVTMAVLGAHDVVKVINPHPGSPARRAPALSHE